MQGNRKLVVILVYLVGIFVVAGMIVVTGKESLLGLTGLAGGVASGLWTFMWGNAKEHQAKSAGAGNEAK